MLRIRNLLFPTDFSPCAEHAFVQATYLAEHFEATLHVLNVITPQDKEALHLMEYLVEEEVPTHGGGHVSAPWGELDPNEPTAFPERLYSQIREPSPAVGILDYADRNRIDLIVMGTHGRRGLNRLLLGSVAEQVVRLASCPVFTVREGDPHEPRETIRRVLVPVDFSDSSAPALAHAAALAGAYPEASIDLLHVIQEMQISRIYGVEAVHVAVPDVKARVRDGLERLAEEVVGGAVPVRLHVRIGHPVLEIVDFAEKYDADVVVIATHGLTGVRRLLLGSVTEKVIRMAPCPVFAVKS